jgi:AcrR family transcriptional regulator
MVTGQRARKQADKAARERAIVAAGWTLFGDMPYAAITMDAVAAHVGLAKGTLYLYFPTKEALFLAVVEAQLGTWFAATNAALAECSATAGADTPARVIAASLTARPALVRLLTILHTILEQNIDLETARRFKRFLLARMTETGALLEGALPGLAPGEGVALLLRIYALVLGLAQLADPAPVVRTVLADPELAPFAIDFGAELARALPLLIPSESGSAEQGAAQ